MDPILVCIALFLAGYGLYNVLFALPLLMVPPVTTLVFIFLLKAVVAFVAAAGVWQRQAWASFAVIVLGAVVAATWLYEGFVLGIVAYLYAFFAAVVAILLTLAIVAYLNGWFSVRVTGGPRPLAGKPL